ncbi:hypothetical protein A3D07_04240 [Candidatus Curtissbacteria bacterium RIFCSPHIGHO2_02_FULL_42_15]|uniref:Sortase n=1 Tax=Candidatus Curtissbacteria bacterium RIFCSPHIGHO2_02_FULL_42_15 TaxID=1797716 RepID=A0A1F5GGP1_9BACT|nr:MAG: hypothetical protein A3D07_04240 [Candidatus Curtissbacteria bacterium RIFCSPHIGHO2_02_FULL_42_15]
MAATSRSRKKKSPIRLYFSQAFAIFLILAGAGLIFWSSFRQGYGWQTPTQAEPQLNQEQTDKEAPKPAKIYIPKLERTLDVSDGFIKDNRWTVSQTGVSYLINSGRLGEPGNVVLYGHNTKDVLGSLWKVQAGDIVEVTDSEGNIHKFEIFERKEVKPNSVEILESTEDSRLTIYTCSGFLDTARFVVVAKKVS